jgi:hypothetical protein
LNPGSRIESNKNERRKKENVLKARENQRETEIRYGSEVVPARPVKGSLGSKEEVIGSKVFYMQQREEMAKLPWKERIWGAALCQSFDVTASLALLWRNSDFNPYPANVENMVSS